MRVTTTALRDEVHLLTAKKSYISAKSVCIKITALRGRRSWASKQHSPLDVDNLFQLRELLHHDHAVVGPLVGLSDQRREGVVQQLASMVHEPWGRRRAPNKGGTQTSYNGQGQFDIQAYWPVSSDALARVRKQKNANQLQLAVSNRPDVAGLLQSETLFFSRPKNWIV